MNPVKRDMPCKQSTVKFKGVYELSRSNSLPPTVRFNQIDAAMMMMST